MSSSLNRRAFIGTGAAALVAGVALKQAPAQAPASKRTKVIGISCSPRKGKTTATALQAALEAAKGVESSVEVELIELAGLKIDLTPVQDQPDDLAKVIEKLADPKVGGVIIGSPVYMGTMSTLCKLLLDRMMVLRKNNFALQNKAGGALAVGGVRNGGQETTLQAILLSLLCHDMVIVGDGKPTAHWGATLLNNGNDEITGDEFGLATAKGLGRRVAEVALKMSK